MSQQWLVTILLIPEQYFRRVTGSTEIAQTLTTIEPERAERQRAPTRKAA